MRVSLSIFPLAAAVLLAAPAAHADEAWGSGASASASTNGAEGAGFPHGLSFGLRTGFMLPMGDRQSGKALGDSIAGGIPIWLDAGYRITPNLYAGLTFDYAFLFPKNCPSGASCSASQLRFGLNGHYHFMPAEKIDPWAGVGIGYEILSPSISSGGQSADATLSGFEFVSLQGGADYKLTDAIAVGPFLAFSLGSFGSATVNGNDVQGFDSSIHGWLTIGVRGKYDL
jgi:opacity protein-like surface antigen